MCIVNFEVGQILLLLGGVLFAFAFMLDLFNKEP
jgi:hypothetical protein